MDDIFSLQNGQLLVLTFPSDASIFVDDIQYLRIDNPVLIAGLSPGFHTYRISAIGYQDTIGSVNILAGATSQLTISLKLSPTIGTLDISSTPPGARIFIDNIDTFRETPSVITTIRQGAHDYKLTLKDHFDKFGKFFQIAGETVIINETLTPINSTTGSINISSSPSGAKIFIDSIDTSKITPAIINNLTPGTHNYRLELPGYRDAAGTFSVIVAQTTDLNIILEQIPSSNGSLSISSIPSGARIFIDEMDTGRETPAIIGDITPGSHSFRLIFPEHQDSVGLFTIRSGITTTVSMTLASIYEIENQKTIGNLLVLGLIMASGLTLMSLVRKRS